VFTGVVGGTTRLGAVAVTSGATVSASQGFSAASFTQNAGTATTFTGLLNLSGAFNFTGTALNINGNGNNQVGTTMVVNNSGVFTTANVADLTVGNAFTQNGAGLNTLGGDIASTNDGISFNSGVTLQDNILMSTGAGAGDNILFSSTLNGTAAGAQTLGLTAGAGTITFTGAVGSAVDLGAVTVTTAGTVLAFNIFEAVSFTQLAGTVSTTFNGLLNLSGAFDFTGTGLTINGNGNNQVGTTMEVTNSGVFTTASGANLRVGNEFIQNGVGLNTLGGNLVSTSDGFSFATGVTLSSGITMTTGLGSGDDILFSSTLNGTATGAQTLGLMAGAGNITLTGAVGGTTPLGAVTVNSAENITALNSGNRFSGLVTVGSSQNTALYLNAFDNENLGSVVANQNFTLVSNDALTLNGVAGAGSLSSAQISGFSVGRLILNTGSLSIPADFNYPNIQNLSLITSSGGIDGNGVLTVPNLTLQSIGQTSLLGGNKINNIESIVTGAGLELVNSQNLSLNGTVQSVGNNVITVAGQLVNNSGSRAPFAGTTGSTTLRMLSPFTGGSLSPVAGFAGFAVGYNGVNPGAQNSIIYSVSPLTMFAPSGTVIAGVDLSGTQTGGGQLNTFFTGSDDLNWIIADFGKFNLPKVSSAELEYTIYPKRVEPETRSLPDSTLSQLRQELGRPPTLEEINKREVSMRETGRLRSGSILERSSLDTFEESNEPQENAKITTPSPAEGQVPQANQVPKNATSPDSNSPESLPPVASLGRLPSGSVQGDRKGAETPKEILLKERASAEVGLSIPVANTY
jgi:hypothetical protein